ncbi:MAG: hypothetical protein ACJ750_00985 [Gaiellaceae bacterium]
MRRQPEQTASFADTKDLKRSPRDGYTSIIDNHLIAELGALKLAAIDARQLERYLGRKQGLAPRTRNRHLNLLHSLFKAAERRGLVRSNPVSAVERPREPRRHWRILSPANITDYVRPFHDGRHTSITNAAAAGMSGPALMARAGHSDFKTTQGYIDLAGETFREEEALLEARLFGQKLGQK